MGLANPAFPASTIFDAIASSLQDSAARDQAIKQASGIFTFTLKNASGEQDSWWIDLKSTGAVGKGEKPEGVDKADVTLILSDEEFGKLVEGKANAQKLFMTGKLKVKGNVMKATKAEIVLKSAAPKKAKL